MKMSDVGLVYSQKIEMSAQELALMCTTVGTAVYCEEGNIHSNKLPCVYVPILNSAHGSQTHSQSQVQVHTQYVVCCMFHSLEDLYAFQYEVAPGPGPGSNTSTHAQESAYESQPESASSAGVSGLGHNLIMDASSNLHTWFAYQYTIMELEFNRLNMKDMT